MTFSVHFPPCNRHPHLLLAISSHGFGHLSQAAPVVNQLRKLLPKLRITVRAKFPEEQIKKRILNPDAVQHAADDFGMIMRDALTLDIPASLDAYKKFHTDLPDNVQRLAQELIEQKVDVVLSDIPYLTLAAAQKAGIPSIALCSLNWADILEFALNQRQKSDQSDPSGEAIVHEIREIYQKANHFLLPAPSMAMPLLTNTIAIGPVCDPGVNRRHSLITNDDSLLVLVGMGGMPYKLNPDSWPTHALGKPLRYIVADQIADRSSNPHLFAESKTNLTYADLVASVDLIMTKPGYGMFAEAAAAGVPVLYVERLNWPEADALTCWLQSVAHCTEISTDALHRGDFAQDMQQLLQRGRYAPVPPMGNLQAAKLITRYLTI